MQKEEDKLRMQSERKRKEERKEETQHFGKNSEKYMKDLDWFLNRSQVGFVSLFSDCASIIFELSDSRIFRASLRLLWIN